MKNTNIFMVIAMIVAILTITSCKQAIWIRATKPTIDSILPERLPQIQYAITATDEQTINLTRKYFVKKDTTENGVYKTKYEEKEIVKSLKPLTPGVLLMSRDVKENEKSKKLFLLTFEGDTCQMVFGPDDSKTGQYVLYFLNKDGKYSFSKNAKERKIKFGAFIYDVTLADQDPKKDPNWSVDLFLKREDVKNLTLTKNVIKGMKVGEVNATTKVE